MAEIILYLTGSDAHMVREWINSEDCIHWIVLESRMGNTYRWKAVKTIQSFETQGYALWHQSSGPLTIPSGTLDIPDAQILDPLRGWTQTYDRGSLEMPWFGSNLPGPYSFQFRENGREAPGSLGRSGFSWLGDHFRPIGKAAPAVARTWWSRLRRYVRANGVPIPWPYPEGMHRRIAYAFPNAHREVSRGRPLDANP